MCRALVHPLSRKGTDGDEGLSPGGSSGFHRVWCTGVQDAVLILSPNSINQRNMFFFKKPAKHDGDWCSPLLTCNWTELMIIPGQHKAKLTFLWSAPQ